MNQPFECNSEKIVLVLCLMHEWVFAISENWSLSNPSSSSFSFISYLFCTISCVHVCQIFLIFFFKCRTTERCRLLFKFHVFNLLSTLIFGSAKKNALTNRNHETFFTLKLIEYQAISKGGEGKQRGPQKKCDVLFLR